MFWKRMGCPSVILHQRECFHFELDFLLVFQLADFYMRSWHDIIEEDSFISQRIEIYRHVEDPLDRGTCHPHLMRLPITIQEHGEPSKQRKSNLTMKCKIQLKVSTAISYRSKD